MANEPEISKGGVFFDTVSRKVVKSEPEQGVQLVAPGSEVTPQAQAVVDAYSASPVEEATAPAAVETATAKVPTARRKG